MNEPIIFGLVCFTLGIIASILPGIFKEEWAARKIDRELKSLHKNYDKRNRVDRLEHNLDKKPSSNIPEQYQAEDDAQVVEEEEDKKNPDMPGGYNW